MKISVRYVYGILTISLLANVFLAGVLLGRSPINVFKSPTNSPFYRALTSAADELDAPARDEVIRRWKESTSELKPRFRALIKIMQETMMVLAERDLTDEELAALARDNGIYPNGVELQAMKRLREAGRSLADADREVFYTALLREMASIPLPD